MKKRNIFSGFCDAVPCILPFVVLQIFTPVRIIHENSGLFSVSIEYVFRVEGILVFTLWIAAAAVLNLLDGKIRKALVWISFILSICLLINGETQTDMSGILQGYTRFWPDGRWDAVQNLCLWIAAICLSLVAAKRCGKTVWIKVIRWISAAGAIALVAVSVILVRDVPKQEKLPYATTKGIDTVSSESNIFVFLLDCLDGDYLEQITLEDPHFFDELTGFTEYTNAVSVFSSTVPSMLSMLTGDYENVFQISFDEYDIAWKKEQLFGGLTNKDFEINYYDDVDMSCIFGSSDITETYFRNFRSDRKEPQYSWKQTIEKMLVLSVFRDFPAVFQPFFEQSAADVNSDIVTDSGEIDPFGFYTGSAFLRNMDELQCTEKKQFKLFHIDGAHPPYTYDENGTYHPEGVTPAQEAKGNLQAVMNYLRVLKENGVYENSSVFIIADHGFWVDSSKALQKPTTVAFFYKPAGANGAFTYNEQPVSLKNVVPTILKDAGAMDYASNGIPLDEIPDSTVENRKYYKSITVNGVKTALYEYEIIGDANQMENWVNKEISQLKVE